MKKKSEFPDLILEQVERINGKQRMVKFIRCDNAGENLKKLQNGCAKLGITFEFTAPNTPQQNGVPERRFVTDRDRGLAMMFAAKMSVETQQKLWAEAVSASSNIGNMGVTSKNDKSCDELFTNEKPKNVGSLIQFGRIGYMTLRTKIKKKMVDKTIKCINLGPAEKYSADCYRLYNPATESIVHSRDVRWADWERSDPTQDLTIFEGKVPKAGMGEAVELFEESEDDMVVHDLRPTRTTVVLPPQPSPATPARTRAASKAGRNEEGTTAQTILGALKDAPDKEARAQREARRLDIEQPNSATETSDPGVPKTEEADGTTLEKHVHFCL
jgi:hypothetical protein